MIDATITVPGPVAPVADNEANVSQWSVCHFNPPGRPQGDPDPKGQRFWQQFQTEEEARTVYHRLLKVRDSMLANPDICGPAITVYRPVQITEGK